MKQIERLTLIDKIGRELQSRMSYEDIRTYLKGFGVSIQTRSSSFNGKRVYTKELLADVPADTILAD